VQNPGNGARVAPFCLAMAELFKRLLADQSKQENIMVQLRDGVGWGGFYNRTGGD